MNVANLIATKVDESQLCYNPLSPADYAEDHKVQEMNENQERQWRQSESPHSEVSPSMNINKSTCYYLLPVLGWKGGG